MNDFGALVNSQRKKMGLTQAGLADKLGVTNKTISKWETGNAFPETGLLAKLSDVLDIPVDDMLRGQTANEKLDMEPQMNFSKTTIVKVAFGLVVVAIGVIALILMHTHGFPYTTYLPILMACIAVSIFLIVHAFMMESFHRKDHPVSVKKWTYLFPLSLSVLVIAPLVLILNSANNIQYTTYLPIFLILLIPAALLFLISLGGWIYAQIRSKRSLKLR